MDNKTENWLQEVAGGDMPLAKKRLAWDDLKCTQELFSKYEFTKKNNYLDPFSLELERLFLNSDDPTHANHGTNATNIPFESLYHKLVDHAFIELLKHIKNIPIFIPQIVLLEIKTELKRGLANITAPYIYNIYDAERKKLCGHFNETSIDLISKFENNFIKNQGWIKLFNKYPVLQEDVNKQVISWVEEWGAFAERLESDYFEICSKFIGQNATLLRVTSASGDRHLGSPSVKILEFSNHKKVVYKSRPITLECRYYDLLGYLKKMGASRIPRPLELLERTNYGWVEYVNNTKESVNLKNWFTHAGGILCLFYLLGGNDGHMENVLSQSDGPVLIDLETLMQPRFGNKNQNKSTFEQAADKIADSVLQTGLLPVWQRGYQGKFFDIGGFSGTGGYDSLVLQREWKNIGMNGLKSAWRRNKTKPEKNLPSDQPEKLLILNNLAEFEQGFNDMWTFIDSHRNEVIAELEKWTACSVRVLLRPTSYYGALLHRAREKDVMIDRLDRSIIFEALYRPLLRNNKDKPKSWEAVPHEISSLHNGDIPIFYVKAGDTHLVDRMGNVIVQDIVTQSPLNSAIDRIREISDDKRLAQIDFIRSTMISPIEIHASETNVQIEKTVDDYLQRTVPISDEALIQVAKMCCDQLIKSAITGSDGFVTWLTNSHWRPEANGQQGQAYYLYNGSMGIALFLATYGKLTSDKKAVNIAKAALRPIVQILEEKNKRDLLRNELIGGCVGLGSIIYGLTHASNCLHDKQYLQAAHTLCQEINFQKITQDKCYDILNGAAGAIKSLLAHYRVNPTQQVLEAAIGCGEHLSQQSESLENGGKAWKSWPDQMMLAGYSHGTAGIISALSELSVISGRNDFAQLALAGLTYERSLYDEGQGNWPIVMPDGSVRFMNAWSHGAAGIWLGRLSMLGRHGHDADAAIMSDIKCARQACIKSGINGVDHMTGGALGRIEVMLEAGSKGTGTLASSDQKIARLGITLLLQRAQRNKAFRFHLDTHLNCVFQPGLFTGISGVGYTCLRMLNPKSVPSLLNWEV